MENLSSIDGADWNAHLLPMQMGQQKRLVIGTIGMIAVHALRRSPRFLEKIWKELHAWVRQEEKLAVSTITARNSKIVFHRFINEKSIGRACESSTHVFSGSLIGEPESHHGGIDEVVEIAPGNKSGVMDGRSDVDIFRHGDHAVITENEDIDRGVPLGTVIDQMFDLFVENFDRIHASFRSRTMGMSDSVEGTEMNVSKRVLRFQVI